MESLPFEIRTDILTRLDTKTLTRFLCVSKPFSFFVSTPDFISAQRRLLRLRPLPSSARLLFRVLLRIPDSYGLVSFDTTAESSRDTGIRTNYFPRQEVKTSLDLVCLKEQRIYLGSVSILNPTSGYFFSLPEQPLGFSPFNSHGFGYVSSTGRYKLLQVIIGLDCVVADTHVFTLDEDESWRCIGKEENTPRSLRHCSPATIDHSVYFLGVEEDVVLFKFDLEREEWSVLPPLPFGPKSTTGFLVEELGGKLCLVDKYVAKNNNYIEIWVLKDFDSYSWVKAYDINMSSYVSVPDKFEDAHPLAVEKDDKLLISVEIDHPSIEWYRTKLLRYDPRNGRGEYINLDGIILSGNIGRSIAPLTFYVDSSSAPEG